MLKFAHHFIGKIKDYNKHLTGKGRDYDSTVGKQYSFDGECTLQESAVLNSKAIG